jgi:hypothetical protein
VPVPDGVEGPPDGREHGGWLPPAPAGPPPPGPPAGWRISPKAVDTDPNAPPRPPAWADQGNTQAAVALGLSAAAFSSLFFGVLAVVAPPLGVAGTVVALAARRRIQRGETGQGKAMIDVALACGITTTVISLIVIVAVVAT